MPVIPVDPQCVTPAWLSEVLGADVRECRLEQIAIGVGLLGRLFRAHLVGGPDVPATVIVKLPTLDITARTQLCEAADLYMREVRFYEQIGLGNPLQPARPYHAAFDAATHDFVLVLEDLGRLRNADQIVGCTEADAETVIDAIARHHAYWWDNERLASLPWLTAYDTPPFPQVIASNYEAAWPKFLERFGPELSPACATSATGFPSLIPWFFEEFARPPHTFIHGDLRLDQLFFAVGPEDQPVRPWTGRSAGRAVGPTTWPTS